MRPTNVVAGAILRNTATGTYHPILYRDSPLPGPVEESKPRRLKSICHHTHGFSTPDEAKDNMAQFEGAILDTENLITWDGLSIPASTAFLSEGKIVHP